MKIFLQYRHKYSYLSHPLSLNDADGFIRELIRNRADEIQ